MAGTSDVPVVHFDYDFSPYSHKIRVLLRASDIPFHSLDQPMLLPRPDLLDLGITYRRIPLLALGKDVYCDTAAITAAIQRHYPGRTPAASPADSAYAMWSVNTFAGCMATLRPGAFDETFIKDRRTIFPQLADPNFWTLRPSALAEARGRFLQIQDEFLEGGKKPFVGGDQLSMADVHTHWPVRWLLFFAKLGREPGFAKEDWPIIYAWLDRMPKLEVERVDSATGKSTILNAPYISGDKLPFDENDSLGIKAGTDVIVEGRDTKRGAHPQAGRLVGLNRDEIILLLENGIRLHFPRIGYAVFENEAKL